MQGLEVPRDVGIVVEAKNDGPQFGLVQQVSVFRFQNDRQAKVVSRRDRLLLCPNLTPAGNLETTLLELPAQFGQIVHEKR